MAVLAPAQAHLVPLEEIPDSVFADPGTAVLYPDDSAVGAEDLARSDVPVTNVIVVDSLVRLRRPPSTFIPAAARLR